MPVAGSYRSIDFTTEQHWTNSHIQKVAVLTQYNARSLNEHLMSSKWWDFGRKQGGLYVFYPHGDGQQQLVVQRDSGRDLSESDVAEEQP